MEKSRFFLYQFHFLRLFLLNYELPFYLWCLFYSNWNSFDLDALIFFLLWRTIAFRLSLV